MSKILSESVLGLLRNDLGVTLSAAIARLGLMPNECGPGVKAILAGTDECAMMALGCYLEDCVMKRSWGSLAADIAKIEAAQKRQEEKT